MATNNSSETANINLLVLDVSWGRLGNVTVRLLMKAISENKFVHTCTLPSLRLHVYHLCYKMILVDCRPVLRKDTNENFIL